MELEVPGPTPSGKPTCEEVSPAQRPYWDRWFLPWPLDLELGTEPSHAVVLEWCQGWPTIHTYLRFIVLHKLAGDETICIVACFLFSMDAAPSAVAPASAWERGLRRKGKCNKRSAPVGSIDRKESSQ